MEKLTLDNARRGAVIIDNKTGEQFLIIEVKDKSLDCLTQKFERAMLGIEWIDNYSIVDVYDMNKFSHWITNSE